MEDSPEFKNGALSPRITKKSRGIGQGDRKVGESMTGGPVLSAANKNGMTSSHAILGCGRRRD
ncbi:hypothetical protein [Thiohalophilus sp.]|uniref:hypothetical protein n=1 Tax=Thiohalophilus sp. TaxID=3028392 RepID=UPI002ACECC32|nr:hypothetical protein [Thiohalophilus sp.]MDZ7805177.1 hypothetical protein [Thiohalophilus sp.]